MDPSSALRVAVSGAGGLIGSALVRRLTADGHTVVPLVRRTPATGEIGWDPEAGRLDARDLQGIDAIIHLAGENIGVRWTPARKARILASRVKGTRLLSEAVGRMRNPPRAMISASAVGIYGDRGDEILTEDSSLGPADDFLVATGQQWEAAADAARAAGIRVIHPRFGLVLSGKGGALGRMLLPFRLGIGGRLGRGSQWMSWISIDDVVGALVFLMANEGAIGPVNVTSPAPVRNHEFTRTLGRVLSRPAIVPVPSLGLRLVFGEMADAALLASTRAVPQRLLELGFRFQHTSLEAALREVLRKDSRATFRS
ncbi:MAG TPA: TIGR01777 family oxidoreductase [Gemmatimonadales bacterium]|nr:TIGR01777 family oxidoreductase [Gemmatimonadales bacterium]